MLCDMLLIVSGLRSVIQRRQVGDAFPNAIPVTPHPAPSSTTNLSEKSGAVWGRRKEEGGRRKEKGERRKEKGGKERGEQRRVLRRHYCLAVALHFGTSSPCCVSHFARTRAALHTPRPVRSSSCLSPKADSFSRTITLNRFMRHVFRPPPPCVNCRRLTLIPSP
eukprot:scaffold7028_cov243-Pinguiococcus_pyrenoidosus.AAC.10